jgi:hypothetical protein
VSRREEWQEQVKLSSLLDRWLDDTCTFGTATDPVASSAKSGAMRKKRGVKPGLPDTLILYRGKLVTLELKSRQGKCSASQRAAREALLRAGAEWWECRSAHAAMWALRKSGVRFRTLVHNDGTTERWRQPRLARWEVPRRDPAEPRPNAPQVAARRRAARQRWRERQPRARETGNPAPEPPHAGAQTARRANRVAPNDGPPGYAVDAGSPSAGPRWMTGQGKG